MVKPNSSMQDYTKDTIPVSELGGFTKEIWIERADRHDKKRYRADYYITASDNNFAFYFTSNIFELIAEKHPRIINLETWDMDGSSVGLYVNTLLLEGYEVDAKNALDGEGFVYGHLKFVRTIKNDEEYRKDYEEKKLIAANKRNK